jgi:hypothetical protein
MRWRIARYLIENREAAVGVQMFHMRQRWGPRCGVAGANAGPPWWAEVCPTPYRGGKGLSRAVQRTRRRRPVGGHTPVGLATVGGLAGISAGVLGTAATWVASTGSRAAGGEAQTPRLAGACWPGPAGGRSVVFVFWGGGGAARFAASESPFQNKIKAARGRPVGFWGARCAAWPVVKARPQKINKTTKNTRLRLALGMLGLVFGLLQLGGCYFGQKQGTSTYLNLKDRDGNPLVQYQLWPYGRFVLQPRCSHSNKHAQSIFV